MDHSIVIQDLTKNKSVFQSLLSDVSDEFRLWRPSPEKWSLHEIVCHLLDEERFDFRARVNHVLKTPGHPMPPIDPAGWVQEKNYISWNYTATLREFLLERENSLKYLQELVEPNWQLVHHHHKLGTISAGQLLYNWLAHDYLHFRQVTRYQYMFLKEQSGIDLGYAGDW